MAECNFKSSDVVCDFFFRFCGICERIYWNLKANKSSGNIKMSGNNIDNTNGLVNSQGITNNKSLPQSPTSMVSSESETQSISDEQTASTARQVLYIVTHIFIDLLKLKSSAYAHHTY